MFYIEILGLILNSAAIGLDVINGSVGMLMLNLACAAWFSYQLIKRVDVA
jgi:hypothetical protein